MDKAEFDKFADEYRALHARNIRISGEGPEFFAEYKVRDVARHLGAARSTVARILDFGQVWARRCRGSAAIFRRRR